SLEGAVVQGPDGNFHLQGIESLQNATTYEYEDYTGTSMAAPHVTGALALLFERYPYLTNAQVRDVLLTTATDLGAPGVDDVYGWGMVNLKKAIEGYGQFRVDTDVNMVAKAGGTHWWNDARVWDVWTNDISGAAFSFSSDAGGWLRLAGNNSFAGLTVNSGTLELTGDNTLGSDVVVNGGVLRNNGTLRNKVILNGGLYAGAGALHGDFHLAQGGSIAPGNSIGTLTINGNYVQEAGTRFFVDMAPPDSTDKLEVTGTATLNGGTVVAVRMPGVYGLGQRYNFLTAQGGLSGQFDGVDNSYLGPFLKMVLAYDSHNAYADVVRNATLASAGKTPNQQATGAALDGLVDNNALLQALVLLPSTADAARAFDQLSGEAHGSVRSVLADDSRHLRNAALSRARTGLDAFTAQGTGAGFSVWADYQSRGGALQGDFNTAYTRYDGHQWLVGGDYQLENGLRIGLFGGSGRLDGNIGHRSSKFEVRNNSLGLHVGGRWSGFGVFAGYTHGKQDIDVKRTVNFAGFSAGLNSDYSAKTRQGFVEVGYLFGGERFQAEPYLQYADVRVKTDGFKEMGSSPAALGAVGQSNDLKVTTGGVRASLNLAGSQQDATWLSLRAGVGYRHASGDLSATSVQSFNGSPAFAVLGAPVAKKATVADLGIAARMSERSLLEVGYSGQYADEGNDHGAHARFTFKF
ncbi:autotransporter outer membrane beta-barrel domain-containing protein, partial [Lysobacteraceae bacterium NML120232]